MVNDVKKQIKELAESILGQWSFFLVDLKIQGGKQTTVWIYVDSENKDVGLDECAEVSKELGFLLDAHEVLDNYRLNISSPGLSRPLVDARQYPKNMGRKARVKFKIGGSYEKLEGILSDSNDENILLETEDGEKKTIAFDNIVETKIIPKI